MKYILACVCIFMLCGFNYAGPESVLLDIINQERNAHDAANLSMDWEIARLARYKAEEMQNLGFLCHNSPAYGQPSEMLKLYNIPFEALGANVAMGQETAQEVAAAWFSSAAHADVLLSQCFTHAGVACATNSDGMQYWVIILVSFTTS